MADPKFPYVKWRDGRPRSSHGVYARALGFVDADLRHPPHDENGRPVGAWFNLHEASDFSDKRKSEIEAARRAGKLPKKITVRKRTTIEDLLDDWSKSAEFKALSAASQSSYRKCISAILYRPQTREAAAKMRAEIRAAKLPFAITSSCGPRPRATTSTTTASTKPSKIRLSSKNLSRRSTIITSTSSKTFWKPLSITASCSRNRPSHRPESAFRASSSTTLGNLH
jgi:hypothetical protein